MSQEYEAQILDINKKDFRKSLKKLGGKRVHKKFKMMRSVYELCTETTKGFVRVRKEYSGTTIKIKTFQKNMKYLSKKILKKVKVFWMHYFILK